MLAQPTGTDPDYHNPSPAGTTLRAPVTSTPGAITVDLSSAPPADPLATQQLVFTVQGALGVTTPVRLLHDGVPVGWCARGSPRPRKARCSRPSGSRWSFRRVGYTVRISEDDPSDGAGRPVLTDDRSVVITPS